MREGGKKSYMLSDIKSRIAKEIARVSEASEEEALASIETPKFFGDMSSKISFVLAGMRKINPADIAKEIAESIKLPETIEKAEAAGPYINFYLSSQTYEKAIEGMLKKKKNYGQGKRRKEKAMIEFPSINPNKPWHIGHLRNALLGDGISRLLEFYGYKVERVDYIDDMGLQVAQSLYLHLSKKNGENNLIKKDNDGKKFDHFLGEEYVEIAKKFENDTEIQNSVREIMTKLEQGNNEIAKKGRMFAEKCVNAQYETAFRLGIFHDLLVFESDILRMIFQEGLNVLKKNSAIVLQNHGKNAGCWVISQWDKVLIRSDGTATYTGKDIIFHLWKLGKLKKDFRYVPFLKQPNGKIALKSSPDGKKMKFGNADWLINVIGMEQKQPQQIISQVLEWMGYEKEAKNLIHLAYEHVGLEDSSFSGRAGTWIGYTADELLDEAKKRAEEKIKPDIEGQNREEIAEKIGIGAVKFSFLRTSADKKITFRWDIALNLDGDSGPYIQYAYVRCAGILKKAKESRIKPKIYENYNYNKEEKILIKTLMEFPDKVEKCASSLQLHPLADYLLDVAAQFNKFYTTSPVLTAENKEEKETRLALVAAAAVVLKNGLSLYGIEVPERM